MISVNELPHEIFSDILNKAAQNNEHEGYALIFGLHQAPYVHKPHPMQNYVRGLVCPDMLRWDATAEIRLVCLKWHDWALKYALEEVYMRSWGGAERLADTRHRRGLYAPEKIGPVAQAQCRTPRGD